MAKYFLSPHTFACVAGEQVIFLDLERDKYTAIGPGEVRTLKSVVPGWPAADPDTLNQSAANDSIVHELLAEGLLTADATSGKAFAPPDIEPASTTIDHVRGRFPKVDVVDLRRFAWAWALVTTQMRTMPIKRVLRRVRNRKQALKPHAPPWDVVKAHTLRTTYLILRPNFFNAKNQCLRDSLTLIEFYAMHGMYPDCVFGVKSEPFSAHAWVQEGPMVLNDYIPHVTSYTPIMVV